MIRNKLQKDSLPTKHDWSPYVVLKKIKVARTYFSWKFTLMRRLFFTTWPLISKTYAMFELYNKVLLFHNEKLESYSCHEGVAHKKPLWKNSNSIKFFIATLKHTSFSHIKIASNFSSLIKLSRDHLRKIDSAVKIYTGKLTCANVFWWSLYRGITQSRKLLGPS